MNVEIKSSSWILILFCSSLLQESQPKKNYNGNFIHLIADRRNGRSKKNWNTIPRINLPNIKAHKSFYWQQIKVPSYTNVKLTYFSLWDINAYKFKTKIYRKSYTMKKCANIDCLYSANTKRDHPKIKHWGARWQ